MSDLSEKPAVHASVDTGIRNFATPFRQTADTPLEVAISRYAEQSDSSPRGRRLSPHLRRLEAESIEIMREVVAQFRNPVFLYSIGKDSTTMLHLARKAFYPAPPPFPFLHIATTWDFHEMIIYRDILAAKLGIELRVHTNEDGLRRGINPIASGPTVHAQVMSTEGLKQALDKWQFDAAFGGARRDEEKSRAKERIFSFRTSQHTWDPRNQRPELWNIYNTRVARGESIRVFPISNWTETDIWSYIAAEEIPVVPLYFSKVRPIVRRQGGLLLVDDERLRLNDGEVPEMMRVRFRTLGCYPLTAGMESSARNVDEIVAEMLASRKSERQGRLIDHDESASMERKKREGYF
ncbi:sulfate adenylyltransferase subunit CysD [Acidisphaera sp. S103]|uniref:sulfate adenylyltransferase subunit CysD n=1 Tax=Acidisphaera sp. S103 TaxID=1747223 RepID=UPI00131D9F41|nr:sulfate adenylyltransferase subunit CysD [Acidisphaera sp. S103]